jgi:YVTN family beta-propeller protein
MNMLARLALVAAPLLCIGCKSDPVTVIPPPPPALAKAVWVLNEGAFGQVEARLSLYDPAADTVYRDVFEGANSGQHLGSTGDDMTIMGQKAYILMSGSENLDVVNTQTYALLQTVSLAGSTPHDLLIDSAHGQIVITRLFKNSLYFLDLATLGVRDSVSVGTNPQGMASANRELFVCNSGYGSDSTVTVVDLVTHAVRATLRTGAGPTGIVVAPNGKLWVACTGNAFAVPPSKGSIFIINPSTNAVEDSILFGDNLWGGIARGSDGYAYLLGVSAGSFYGGPVHRVKFATNTVTLNYFAGTYYAIAVEEHSGDLYIGDAKNFSADGVVSIVATTGALKKSFTAQKGPGVIAFSY